MNDEYASLNNLLNNLEEKVNQIEITLERLMACEDLNVTSSDDIVKRIKGLEQALTILLLDNKL